MIRCVIIDDEPLAIELLADYVKKTEGLELVGSFTNPIEGLNQLENLQVELVFLDVQMPELNGIQFLKIKKGRCHFVLTTAYEQYALDGFNHDVIDYLLKPISLDRFLICAEKIKTRIQPESLTKPKAAVNSDFIFVKSEYKTIKIKYQDIRFVEGLSDYVAIHVADKKILSLDTLRNFFSRLPNADFIRVHKSYIVNVEHIDHIERNQIIIGERRINIGATYLKEFQKRIG